MFQMMDKFRKNMKNRKGFTLIELIVVIAILGIIALIAIPRFAGIQEQARIDADAATARQIINTFRVVDAVGDTAPEYNDSTNRKGYPAGNAGVWTFNTVTYMEVPVPRTGGNFVPGFDASGRYTVTFGTTSRTVTEGVAGVSN